MIITRNQAICMLFYVDYSEENVKKCEKKIEDLGDFEICYNADPKQPILVSKQRIRGDPFTYRTYLPSDDMPDNSLKRKRIEFLGVTFFKMVFECSISILKSRGRKKKQYSTEICHVMEEQFHENGRQLANSLTTRVYVSFSSCASTPFRERDTTASKSVLKLTNVNGDTQDMLHYLQSAKHNICLVSIDYAGLTSRSQELRRLIENNEKIKKIAIDTFALDSEIHIFDTKLLASDPSLLTKFDCRKKILQRSK
ncbi:hypothetical protein BDF20DRAFT_839387 [Mycotypha africana]|uniref:uncharacterized protein n=1 Tax=Mycotypha africana TaxID=64632 RepID=UPI002300BBE4|nr:uncharacterized protein BDF20DRAFT_839387 [Mycotypha africana]KAI8968265.1 hypothetical protein BDF20DRAFT_839387 [Mycotypha africana]